MNNDPIPVPQSNGQRIVTKERREQLSDYIIRPKEMNEVGG